MRKKGFTLIELLVVIAIIAMLLAILMPALNKVKKIAMRVVCGTNLKGMGTAQTVYANDYEGSYAQQDINLGGGKNWAAGTQYWSNPDPAVFATGGNLTVGASLYLLVREADVSPKSFVCPAGGETAFEGQNGNAANPDITEMWDFGANGTIPPSGVARSLSYSYHMPYTRFAADDTRSAAFAIMSDRNPWFDPKLTHYTKTPLNSATWRDGVQTIKHDWDPSVSAAKWEINRGNAQPHDRDGQNVLFGDGHNAFEKRSDVGVKHDNIFTQRGGNYPIRKGIVPAPAFNVAAHAPLGSTDSYLVNDTNGDR